MSIIMLEGLKETVSGIFNSAAKQVEQPEKEARSYRGSVVHMGTVGYNGEKTPGEIGVIKNYKAQFKYLRMRSWQSYYESEITQNILDKYITWAVGTGLKVQSEPVKLVLQDNGITVPEDFVKRVETRFALFTKSKLSDHAMLNSLNKQAKTAMKNAKISGDCLVLLRFSEKYGVTVQVVDGENVVNPLSSIDERGVKARGNTIDHGVEKNAKGAHVAYWVKQNDNTIRRISAKDRLNRSRAFLVYGKKYRISDDRGMPWVSVVLETLKKLERYKEAAVGSAEERAKVPWYIKHDKDAEGTNPMVANQIAQSVAKKTDSEGNTVSSYEQANDVAHKVKLTEQKEAYNLPPGSEMKAVDTDADTNFIDFYKPNFQLICGALQIPPEVAMSMYDSNYSASRAAIKDWENTLFVERADFGEQFYQPVFDFWLDVANREDKIEAPGYRDALVNQNFEVLEAYRNSRWIGPAVPHIDPVKEVEAERRKLGPLGVNAPLTTVEKAIENLGGGDYDSTVTKFLEEIGKLPAQANDSGNGN